MNPSRAFHNKTLDFQAPGGKSTRSKVIDGQKGRTDDVVFTSADLLASLNAQPKTNNDVTGCNRILLY